MKFYNYINEKRNMEGTMIGFKVPKTQISRIVIYIKSFLDRFDVEYAEPPSRHITVGQIVSKTTKDHLIRTIHELDRNILFKPKKLTLFEGKNVNRDFLVIEYKNNNKYQELVKLVQDRYDTRTFPGGMKPHVSLFNFPKGQLSLPLFNEIDQRTKRELPDLIPSIIELWNNKFKIEWEG